MSNVTQINTEFNSNATVINVSANQNVGSATVINTEQINQATQPVQGSLFEGDNATAVKSKTIGQADIPAGTVLCDTYVVDKKLDVTTGEADLYICSFDYGNCIAKVYRRNVSIKKEITEKLKSIASPYVARVIATGEYNGYPVEIQPYYSNGSLQGKIYTAEDLKKYVIPCLNEGLKVLHDNDIIHKDLKPSNIMLLEDGKGVAIIDFGISSVREDGNTVVVTQTGFTPDYSAPETFKNLFLSDSDYYSLGITIYELATGKLPYSKMTQQEIERYISIQRLPMPKEMDKDLKDLIRALTYYDITNRKNKANPNRRWGYEEVDKWLKGIKQTIPGEGVGNRNIKPFIFLGKEYRERKELVKALAENWKDGKKALFRGQLSDYFNAYDSDAENICIQAEQEAAQNSGMDDLIFWKTLYKMDTECQKLFWKGCVFNSLADLGRSLLEALRAGNKTFINTAEELLRFSILSQYLKIMQAGTEKHLTSLTTVEETYRNNVDDDRQVEVLLYVLAYWLSGQKLLIIGKDSFGTISELAEHMKELQEISFEKIQSFCHRLVEREGVLIPELEAWLMVLGKKEELNRWKGLFNYFDRGESF